VSYQNWFNSVSNVPGPCFVLQSENVCCNYLRCFLDTCYCLQMPWSASGRDQIIIYTLWAQSIKTKTDAIMNSTAKIEIIYCHSAQPCWTTWVSVVTAAAHRTVFTTTLCLKKTSPMFLAITRESIAGFP